MQSRNKWRWAAIIAPPLLALGIATLVACRDALTSATVESPNDARVTPRIENSPDLIRARARLHERNRYDWVGVAHNQAIDDLRAEIRKPGAIAPAICDYVADFSTRPERLPPRQRLALTENGRVFASISAKSELCRKQVKRSRIAPALLGSAPQEITAVSPVAIRLLADVDAAIGGAVNSYDLANKLQPILNAAGGLAESDAALVSAVVSIAQSSLEYWEKELPAAEQEFANEFAPCAWQIDPVLSSEQAFDVCLNGNTSLINGPTLPLLDQRYVFAASVGAGCGPGLAWRRIVQLVKRDADAGGSGFVGAMIAKKLPPPVALPVAVGIATAASAWEVFKSTWDIFWCAMRPPAGV